MTERTVKIANVEIELTYDTKTGQILEGAMWQNRSDIKRSGCHNMRPYKGKGLLLMINPLGSGWDWNKNPEG